MEIDQSTRLPYDAANALNLKVFTTAEYTPVKTPPRPPKVPTSSMPSYSTHFWMFPWRWAAHAARVTS
jgi:hypothetical protein